MWLRLMLILLTQNSEDVAFFLRNGAGLRLSPKLQKTPHKSASTTLSTPYFFNIDELFIGINLSKFTFVHFNKFISL